MDADSDFEHEGRGGRREKETGFEMDLRAAEKLCWAVVVIRKRCGSASWRDPTANTALAVCCVCSTVFHQLSHILVVQKLKWLLGVQR